MTTIFELHSLYWEESDYQPTLTKAIKEARHYAARDGQTVTIEELTLVRKPLRELACLMVAQTGFVEKRRQVARVTAGESERNGRRFTRLHRIDHGENE